MVAIGIYPMSVAFVGPKEMITIHLDLKFILAQVVQRFQQPFCMNMGYSGNCDVINQHCNAGCLIPDSNTRPGADDFALLTLS